MSNSDILKALVLRANNQQYAIEVSSVVRVIPLVEITQVPNVPNYFEGVIDIQGEVLPVLSLRNLLNLPTKPQELTDKIILVSSHSKTVCFLIDEVEGVHIFKRSELSREKLPEYIDGALRNKEEILFFLKAEALVNRELLLDSPYKPEQVKNAP